MKITTIGSGMMDIYVQSSDFSVRQSGGNLMLCQVFGAKIEIDNCVLTSGGGATNTAVAFARQGHQVSCVIEVGKDVFGRQLLEELRAENVDVSQVIKEDDEQTGFSVILVGGDGQRSAMINRGAAAMLDAKDINPEYLAKREHLHLASVGGRVAALKEIWKVLAAVGEKMSFSWNPGKKELCLLAEGKLKLPTVAKGIFVVNREEWKIVEKLQAEIKKLFYLVVVTAGRHGGEIYQWHKLPMHFEPSNHEKTVDETGAGDAFCSGLVGAILAGRSVELAVRMGTTAAGRVVGKVGAKAGLPIRKASLPKL